AIGATSPEALEAQPSNDSPVLIDRHPAGGLVRRMGAKPALALFQYYRFNLCSCHPGRDSGVIDFHDAGQVCFGCIPNDHVGEIPGPDADDTWKKTFSKVD